MSSEAVTSLFAKLRSLELTGPEADVLRILLQRAAGSEVEGFGLRVGSLGFEPAAGAGKGFKGTDEELQFKGTDEELQVLVDWLGERRRS